MTKSHLLLTVLLLGGMLSSCSRSTEKAEGLPYRVEIGNMTDSLKISYSDLFSDVRYVVIKDTAEESVIKRLSHLEITKDNDLIVLDDGLDRVLRFDSEGNFLNQIGDKGHAANEYVSPRAMTYDPVSDLVLVYSSGKLLFYHLDGTFDHYVKLKENMIFHITVVQHKYIIAERAYLFSGTEEDKHNFQIYDMEGNYLSGFEYLPDLGYTGIVMPQSNQFCPTDDGGMLCLSTYSSTMYKVKDGEVTPFIEFVPTWGEWCIGRPEQIKECFNKKFETAIDWAKLVDDKLYVKVLGGRSYYDFLLCYDLKTKQMRVGRNIINDVYGVAGYYLRLEALKDRKFYFYFMPRDFERILESWGGKEVEPENKEFVTRMSQLEGQHILQICTLKE
ncbi:MAG: 6-bladed beta-propeller [Bacteroidales bacterium]|nr:6-bladed beta-propeller [Bacteroidales bacterium]